MSTFPVCIGPVIYNKNISLVYTAAVYTAPAFIFSLTLYSFRSRYSV